VESHLHDGAVKDGAPGCVVIELCPTASTEIFTSQATCFDTMGSENVAPVFPRGAVHSIYERLLQNIAG
jgi:hypothetical protein